MIDTAIITISALILDWLVGEPKRFHPLVGFGYLANRIESALKTTDISPKSSITRGLLALSILLLPVIALTWFISQSDLFEPFFSLVIVTLCLGHKSLHDHAHQIIDALSSGNQQQARLYTSYIVSRDPQTLDIPRATIESVLENGSDSVFAAIFWFVVAGAPGIIFYRLSNTLDAMWGYRNQRYLYFGRGAALLDDILNYIPARLTALSYSLLGSSQQALHCWKTQSPLCDSPNAGPVMAAGAGALGITLGGPAQYAGVWHQRPILGCGPAANSKDIARALSLVRKSVLLWLIIILVLSGLTHA